MITNIASSTLVRLVGRNVHRINHTGLFEYKINPTRHGVQYRSFSSSSAQFSLDDVSRLSSNRSRRESEQLSSSLRSLTLITRSSTPQEYSLPTLLPNNYAKQIKDPVLDEKVLVLPMYNGLLIDHFAPAVGYAAPVSEPRSERTPAVKECRRLSMIRIRYKKMKKHQLKKLRKRMRFLKAKQKAVKLKKKEKIMREYEQEQAKVGEEFDADKCIEDHMRRGREAGWGIDILAERASKRASVPPK